MTLILKYILFLLLAFALMACSREEIKGGHMQHDDNRNSNRLINEKSPYLLQHAYNPVDWYPWGEDAFEAAAEQDKPIFLSIGYSTCHWCHVMEHESFEDSSVATLMNDAFVNIKVDREERPDVDDIYMTVCQMMTQSGGWPLTIIMTPEKKPFFAATYIPKETRFNRRGMMDLVPLVKDAWQNRRTELLNSANRVTEHLQSIAAGSTAGAALTDDALNQAREQLTERYDPEYGGFSEQPKFPTAHNLMFLLREYARSGDTSVLEMVENTLTNMRLGGVFDHVGFGFHRYSTDRHWLVPHFEKMLYDQAILCMAYAEAYQVTGKEFYRQTAEEILTYVLRDMTDENGGFYSAEDADSEGEEGKFYVWAYDEVLQIAGEEEGKLYCQTYGIMPDGNWEDEATRQKLDTNIPHLQEPLSNTIDSGTQARLEGVRKKLFDVRESRIHPLKDDKILTDWNGLMIAAMSKAAQAFDKDEYAEAAQKAAHFLKTHMYDHSSKRLFHRYREGDIAIQAYLDDYAFLIWGLIELYETNFDPENLQWAVDLAETVQLMFSDAATGGYFFTASDAEELLVRKKEFYDGAIPSGNSVMLYNLVRLSRLTGNTEYERLADLTGRAFAPHVERYAAGHAVAMLGLGFAIGPTYELVVSGDLGKSDTHQMLDAIHRRFLPNVALVYRPSGGQSQPITDLAAFTEALEPVDGKATAYVCRNFACDLPTTDISEMLKSLGIKN